MRTIRAHSFQYIRAITGLEDAQYLAKFKRVDYGRGRARVEKCYCLVEQIEDCVAFRRNVRKERQK